MYVLGLYVAPWGGWKHAAVERFSKPCHASEHFQWRPISLGITIWSSVCASLVDAHRVIQKRLATTFV